jgi:hypothetical protein
MAAFWTDTTVEPKRNFKFILSIPGGTVPGGIQEFLVQKVSKPSIETTATEHTFLNHYFYFPGKSKWSTVQATCVDLVRPVDGNMTATIMNMIEASGYSRPTAIDSSNPASLNTMSKAGATAALGTVKIKTLDSKGITVEEWVLHNTFVQKAEWSELDYGNEELSTCTLTLQYDFAHLEVGGAEIPRS